MPVQTDDGESYTEPSAIISGKVEGRENVLCRVHDACFTSGGDWVLWVFSVVGVFCCGCFLLWVFSLGNDASTLCVLYTRHMHLLLPSQYPNLPHHPTPEVLGSLKCDCSEQLALAMDIIQQRDGIIIYLQQEGRGIGLANKIAAYALQEQGLDTVDANRALGLPDDCREYTSVRNILNDLGIKSIRLLVCRECVFVFVFFWGGSLYACVCMCVYGHVPKR